MLKLEHINKIYKTDEKELYALRDVSLSFDTVQFVSILGPSGCGKTTLLNVVSTLDTFDSGILTSAGKDLSSLSEKEKNTYRNNCIGFVFQNCYLIPHLTVLENVRLALSVRDCPKKESEKKALQALKAVHMEGMKNKRPNQLSGGQQQRVAIARALVTSPMYLLCDEPTGALDSTSSREIMDLLHEISRTRLVLMVTHNEELAKEYSDRIIRMKDGSVLSDTVVHPTENKKETKEEEHASHLSLSLAFHLAFSNLFSRKMRTILSTVANSLGMIGIAFLFAVNYGFDRYAYDLSSSSATSLPIVVSPFNRQTDTEAFSDINQSVTYPDSEEIYPSISSASQYAYNYNNVTPKYLSFLDSLQEEKLIKDYVMSYSASYNFNLTTRYPSSLSGKNPSYLGKVETTLTNYNYYASRSGLPYNIFHVLYGNLDQYDVLAGSLPENEKDVVLVVDKYNAVSFRILKTLGFYNSYDTEEEVRDTSLQSKVKPISFSDVIGKEYRIFDNDEVYSSETTSSVTDGIGHKRTIHHFKTEELTEDFYANHGRTLKISAVLRPKASSAFSLLSPSLCYTQALQDTLMPKNAESSISKSISDNMVFVSPDGSSDATSDFAKELEQVLSDYESSGSSVLPTSDLNEVFNKYFTFYPVTETGFRYLGFSTFFYQAKNYGAELIDDSIKGIDLSKSENIEAQIKKLKKDLLLDVDQAYKDIISLVAYCNAYSSVQCLVIFPSDLDSRSEVLKRMEEYNEISSDTNHANSEEERIYYATSDASDMIEEVSEMISLVTVLLILFAVISMIASSSMNALLVSNNVLERRKEIGLLRSFGTRKSDVILIFEIEAVTVGVLSGIAGSLFTYLLCFPLNKFLQSYLSYYHIGNICLFTFPHALLVILISFAIAFIGSLIPAFKASKVSPVDSLRSE